MHFINKINVFFKGLILVLRPHIFLGWLRRPFLTTANIIGLSKWISLQETDGILNDFYVTRRDYSKRFKLYEFIADKHNLRDQTIDYVELGVSGGYSFDWWLKALDNPENRFYGFDTFEGLPEKWGTFSIGGMAAAVPQTGDSRAEFIKGLFQDTLPGFLAEQTLRPNAKKIIHLDADLFSSTLFSLTSLAPYLKAGDILFFDEFNVPNHEFYAFDIFCKSFYVKTKLLGAVNNYYQVAMMIE